MAWRSAERSRGCFPCCRMPLWPGATHCCLCSLAMCRLHPTRLELLATPSANYTALFADPSPTAPVAPPPQPCWASPCRRPTSSPATWVGGQGMGGRSRGYRQLLHVSGLDGLECMHTIVVGSRVPLGRCTRRPVALAAEAASRHTGCLGWLIAKPGIPLSLSTTHPRPLSTCAGPRLPPPLRPSPRQRQQRCSGAVRSVRGHQHGHDAAGGVRGEISFV